ncbi:MAG: YlmC/YmxH family sporulation protein [Bacilli bacterium]|nr:YlmC/YmxH family sporulation protein [Bacilli bacterium]
MRLSELQSKKIIEIDSGSAVGTIIDISILDDGKVDYFMIEQGKNFFSLNREGDTKIYWSQIVKIGEDVILIQKK